MTYLRFHRMRLGKTQKELAKMIGIKQGTYSDFERGYKKPGAHIHKKMAEALGRPIEEFTGKLYGVDPAEMMSAQPARQ